MAENYSQLSERIQVVRDFKELMENNNLDIEARELNNLVLRNRDTERALMVTAVKNMDEKPMLLYSVGNKFFTSALSAKNFFYPLFIEEEGDGKLRVDDFLVVSTEIKIGSVAAPAIVVESLFD